MKYYVSWAGNSVADASFRVKRLSLSYTPSTDLSIMIQAKVMDPSFDYLRRNISVSSKPYLTASKKTIVQGVERLTTTGKASNLSRSRIPCVAESVEPVPSDLFPLVLGTIYVSGSYSAYTAKESQLFCTPTLQWLFLKLKTLAPCS